MVDATKETETQLRTELDKVNPIYVVLVPI